MRKKPTNQQVGFLRSLLEHNVKAIAEHEDDVRVECSETPARVVFTVFVHDDDAGLVLGERGATANAIRRLIWTACKKTDLGRVDVSIMP